MSGGPLGPLCDGTDDQVRVLVEERDRLTAALAERKEARAAAFKGVSEFVRDAYFRDGLTVQEIAVLLAWMAEGESAQ